MTHFIFVACALQLAMRHVAFATVNHPYRFIRCAKKLSTHGSIFKKFISYDKHLQKHVQNLLTLKLLNNILGCIL